jgi:APA family basic amino acid/polyamine antiporter
MPSISDYWNSSWTTKPISLTSISSSSNSLKRHLSLFDLLCVGIGGTVGTGIFTLCGYIASGYAGPAVILSWMIAGIACLFNGFAYMELSTRIPCAGSTYAYAYVALGELPAVIAGWCLTLEYGISGAAVARSWSKKMLKWIIAINPNSMWIGNIVSNDNADMMAGIVQIAAVAVLLAGVSVGKRFINAITTLKIVVVAFMIIGGFSIFKAENLDVFVPQNTDHGHFGWSGVLLGSTIAFFGFIGFDEVACMAAEAKNPGKVMHKAIIGTIIGTTILSMLAALALVGMQPYALVDPDSAFGYAFYYNNLGWAAQIVQIGEIVTLPVVVLIAFLAQPRLQYAMAEDGLLPAIFAKVDRNGNLFFGTLIGGLICTLIAILVPFDNLNDLCSAGVLFTLTLSNASVIMLRLNESKADIGVYKDLCRKFLIAFFILSAIFSFILMNISLTLLWEQVLVGMFFALLCLITYQIYVILLKIPAEHAGNTFRSPLVPFLPCVSILINWILIAQLSWIGLVSFFGFILLASISYVFYGMKNSSAMKNNWHSILIDQGYNCCCSLCKNDVGTRLFDCEDNIPRKIPEHKSNDEKNESTHLLSTYDFSCSCVNNPGYLATGN